MSMNPRISISAATPSVHMRGGKHGTHNRQRGITLMMSLIFLLLLTILGVTSVNISTLQEKMSGNLRDQDVALQAAESALRYGELMVSNMWLTGKPTPISVSSCTNSDCAWDTDLTDPLNDAWWSGFKLEYGSGSKDLPETTADPSYVIEHLAHIADSSVIDTYGPPPSMEYYRITARGQGTTPFSESILESTYQIKNSN